MPKRLFPTPEWWIHFHSVAYLSHSQEYACCTFPPRGLTEVTDYNKNNSVFSHLPVLKSSEANYFLQRICYCTSLFQTTFHHWNPIFFPLLFLLFLSVYFQPLATCSPRHQWKELHFASLEILEHVGLDVTMNRSAPVALNPWFWAVRQVSIDIYL